MLNQNFWRGKRVFLTGHTGFKGSWLWLWLQSLGAEVTGYALRSPTKPSLFNLLCDSSGGRSLIGDIREFTLLRDAMKEANPDIVIHMAAQALVHASYQQPLETYQTNIIGTANVLESIRQCGHVKAAVIITTDKVYENQEWHWGYRENEPLGGYDPYSSSKACAELVTAAYRRSFLQRDGVAVATARAGNVVGGGDWAADRLIPDCMRAIERKEKIVIRSPLAVRPWQHVLEPLGGYLLLAEKLYEEGKDWAGAWNFGPGDAATLCVGALVEKICCVFQASYHLEEQTAFHEAQFLRLDASRAKALLGWQPLLDMDETVQWICAWYQAYWRGENMREFTCKQIMQYQEMKMRK